MFTGGLLGFVAGAVVFYFCVMRDEKASLADGSLVLVIFAMLVAVLLMIGGALTMFFANYLWAVHV